MESKGGLQPQTRHLSCGAQHCPMRKVLLLAVASASCTAHTSRCQSSLQPTSLHPHTAHAARQSPPGQWVAVPALLHELSIASRGALRDWWPEALIHHHVKHLDGTEDRRVGHFRGAGSLHSALPGRQPTSGGQAFAELHTEMLLCSNTAGKHQPAQAERAHLPDAHAGKQSL